MKVITKSLPMSSSFNTFGRLMMIGGCVSLICGCQNGASEFAWEEAEEMAAEERAVHLESAREDAEAIADDVDDLQTAVAMLRVEIDRLQSENWRDVVPDIDSAAVDVELAASELELSSANLTQNVAQ
ncbi:hypothetical protein G7076_02870 [Sphingomonas sp. HDW15A]|uniref:hypothetical protein n=1 Tax=Sphingomonas sp. HDW15A TaxID=2714942 RepID=UPI0014089131|nr:hypothetical protein [Sphingomonas sp. HDW15A]QIK95560.1 hypothetical protein G7076_02870 [Sphingomonas sp. HDW15A]